MNFKVWIVAVVVVVAFNISISIKILSLTRNLALSFSLSRVCVCAHIMKHWEQITTATKNKKSNEKNSNKLLPNLWINWNFVRSLAFFFFFFIFSRFHLAATTPQPQPQPQPQTLPASLVLVLIIIIIIIITTLTIWDATSAHSTAPPMRQERIYIYIWMICLVRSDLSILENVN